MSAEQFIEGVLSGAIKIAEVDPTLQWGMLGAGVGGAGGLVKSLSSGKSLKDVLKSTLGGAALGGGVGLSGAAGASILGAKPPQVAGVLKPKKEYKGDFSSSAGMGLMGAGGLLAGAQAEESRDRNEAIRKVIQDPHLRGGELLGKGEPAAPGHSKELVEFLKGLKTRGSEGELKPMLEEERLSKLLSGADPQQGLADELFSGARSASGASKLTTPDVAQGLSGKSEMVTKFLEHLKGVARTDPTKKNVAEQILAKLHSPELQQMERFAPPKRFTQVLKNFKGPKGVRNLALAAGGIGLGTYGLSGLGERLWGKKS